MAIVDPGRQTPPDECEYEEDSNYIPTQQDIDEYAQFLGIDREKERELLWIAEKGITARLPDGWKPCATKDGQLFYFHAETSQSSWTHPRDEEFRELLMKERAEEAARARMREAVPRAAVPGPPEDDGAGLFAEAGGVPGYAPPGPSAAATAPSRAVAGAGAAASPLSAPPPPSCADPVAPSPPHAASAAGACSRMRLFAFGAGAGAAPLLQLRVCCDTSFASVAAALQQQPGLARGRAWEIVDEEGFLFPAGELVQKHFPGGDVAVGWAREPRGAYAD